MKAIQLASFGIIPAALLITACGDDVTKVTKIEETSGMEVVATADSLGKCTSELSGKMKFAAKENAVYVCADSIWKNVSEAEKAACSAETLADSSGFKIVCSGDSIGVVKNGANGIDGEKGEAGKDGASGKSCTLVEGPVLESGTSQIRTSFVVCGGDTVMLSDGRPGEGCELSDGGDGTVSVVCGETSTTLYKAFCGGNVYDPDSSFCVADSIVSLCGGESYDLDESFCFADSVVPRCGGRTYDLDSNFCLDGKVYKNKTLVWNLMNPEIEYETFIDSRDGQIYRSVNIGEQMWMAENLNYAYLPDTASFCYGDSLESCQKYGRLYKWSAAMEACPQGWHLPDTVEWNELANYIKRKTESSGVALKTASEWADYSGKSGNGTDDFGFSALPGGFRMELGSYYEFAGETLHAYFWTSSPSTSNTTAHARSLSNATSTLTQKINERRIQAYSVRCVRD